MDRRAIALGTLLAALAVAAGAFGAHGLRTRLEPDLLETFETAARYQFYHALGTILTGIAAEQLAAPWPRLAGWLFVAGIVLFSGSLYLLSLTGVRWLGAVTPFGGAAFLAGWICFAVAALRVRPEQRADQ